MKKIPKSLFAILLIIVSVFLVSNFCGNNMKSYAREAGDMPTTNTTYYNTTVESDLTSITDKESEDDSWYTTASPEEDGTKDYTSPKNQIERMYISDLLLLRHYDGYWTEDYYWDDDSNCETYSESYYRYSINPKEITLIYTDGTTVSGNLDEVYESTGYWIQIDDKQSYENQWDVGAYYVTAEVCGKETNFKVEIVATAIESIELHFSKAELIENKDGRLLFNFGENGKIEQKYFNYNIFVEIEKIEYKKGFEYLAEYGYCYSLKDNQSFETPWGVGKHKVVFSCYGYEEEFEFEVVENKKQIQNISVLPQRNFVQGFDDYNNSDSYYDDETGEYVDVEYPIYSIEKCNPLITISFSDGTSISGTYLEVYDKIGYYVDFDSLQNYSNQWGIGTHTAYAFCGNKVQSFTVEVVESPVEKIEFIKAPDKTQYITGEQYNVKGSIVRVLYKSGNYMDVSFDYDAYGNIRIDDEVIGGENGISFSIYDMNEMGKQKIIATYGNVSCQTPIIVNENKTDKIIIKNDDNKNLIITRYNIDGTSEDCTALNFDCQKDEENDIQKDYYGALTTDKGIFNITISEYNNGLLRIKMLNPTTGEDIKSNYLNACEWFEVCKESSDIGFELLHLASTQEKIAPFDGEVNKCNINDIIKLAVFMNRYTEDVKCINNGNHYEYVCSLDTVEKALSSGFFISNTIDIRDSSYYDEETQMISVPYATFAGGLCWVTRQTYSNNKWIVNCYLTFDMIPSYFTINDDLKITSFYIGEVSCEPPAKEESITIDTYGITEVAYGETVVLTADIPEHMLENSKVVWSANNSNFDYVVSEDGLTCSITAKANGSTAFTISLIGEDENEQVLASTMPIISKAGFIYRMIAFIKRILSFFGLIVFDINNV